MFPVPVPVVVAFPPVVLVVVFAVDDTPVFLTVVVGLLAVPVVALVVLEEAPALLVVSLLDDVVFFGPILLSVSGLHFQYTEKRSTGFPLSLRWHFY